MQAERRSLVLPLLVSAVLVAVVATWVLWPRPAWVQGQIEATQVRVAAKLPGRVEAVEVREGEAVRAGQLLARMATPEIDARALEPFDQLPGARQVQVGIEPQPRIDEEGLGAAPHDDRVERPIESVGRQKHVVQPSGASGRLGIVGQHCGREW